MHILLYNPLARGNRGKQSLQEAIANLKLTKYIVFSILDFDGKKNSLVKTLSEFSKDAKVILIGGDGTLNRFVNKYKNANIAQQILFYAGGTGNDFQRNFEQIEKGATHALLNISKRINNLKVNLADQAFAAVNGIGAGLDGLIIKFYHEAKKSRKLTYMIQTLKALMVYKPSDVSLVLDGEKHEFKRCWLVVINNGKYIGGGMNIAPDASIDDGLLDVCVIHASNKMTLLRNLFKVFKGSHVKMEKYVFYRQAKEVEYSSSVSQYIQYDGELVNIKANRFKVAVE